MAVELMVNDLDFCVYVVSNGDCNNLGTYDRNRFSSLYDYASIM
jgi:hypothetical protein